MPATDSIPNCDFSTPRRMSKSSLPILIANRLKDSVKLLVIFLVPMIYNAAKGTPSTFSFLKYLGLAALIVLIYIGEALLKYYFHQYHIKDGKLVMRHGMLSKTTKSIPLDRVHTLRTKRGLLYRLMGVRGISFDTLSDDDNDLELILSEADWQRLMNRIEAQDKPLAKDEQTADEDSATTYSEAETSENTKTLRIPNIQILKGILCQNHLRGALILGAFLGGVLNRIGDLSDLMKEQVADFIGSMEAQANQLTFTIGAVIVAVVALYIIIAILWTAKGMLMYADTKIRIQPDKISYESGLITRSSSRLGIDKICALYIKRNPLERFCGLSTVIFRQAANVGDNKENDKTEAKIYGCDNPNIFLKWWLGSNYMDSPDILPSAHSGYGLMGYITARNTAYSLAMAIVLFALEAPVWFYAIPALFILFSIMEGFLEMKHSSITLKESYILITSGAMTDIRNYVKYENIEEVRITRSPLTRHFHRVKLSIATKGTNFSIRSISEQQALRIYEQLIYPGDTAK